MCGRFTLRSPAVSIASLFDGLDVPEWNPRYNIAPTQPVPTVRHFDGNRTFSQLRWGLVPSWAKDLAVGTRMINARGETVASKPAFRDAFKQRRCLVLADGFYEWKKQGNIKKPYRISPINEEIFAFAGLWERRENGPTSVIASFTILTAPANSLISPIHARMPVILPPETHTDWLSGSELEPLLSPYPAEKMSTYPLDSYVNDARHDDLKCLSPAQKNSQPDFFTSS